MAKGFKVSKNMLMIGGVVLVAVVVVVMIFRSSEGFQQVYGSPPPTAFNNMMSKFNPPNVNYLPFISEISQNANKSAYDTSAVLLSKIQANFPSPENMKLALANGLKFFNEQVDKAKSDNRITNIKVDKLISDYLDVQLPKYIYFNIYMNSLGTSASFSALLANRYRSNNSVFLTRETAMIQKMANDTLEGYTKLIRMMYDPSSEFIRDMLIAEAKIVAAGAKIPYGGLSSMYAFMQGPGPVPSQGSGSTYVAKDKIEQPIVQQMLQPTIPKII